MFARSLKERLNWLYCQAGNDPERLKDLVRMLAQALDYDIDAAQPRGKVPKNTALYEGQ